MRSGAGSSRSPHAHMAAVSPSARRVRRRVVDYTRRPVVDYRSRNASTPPMYAPGGRGLPSETEQLMTARGESEGERAAAGRTVRSGAGSSRSPYAQLAPAATFAALAMLGSLIWRTHRTVEQIGEVVGDETGRVVSVVADEAERMVGRLGNLSMTGVETLHDSAVETTRMIIHVLAGAFITIVLVALDRCVRKMRSESRSELATPQRAFAGSTAPQHRVRFVEASPSTSIGWATPDRRELPGCGKDGDGYELDSSRREDWRRDDMACHVPVGDSPL